MNKLHKYEIASLFGIGILFIIFGLKDLPFFSFEEFRIFIDSMGYLATIFYTIMAIFTSLLTFPISILIVVAGISFGLKIGFIILVISLTISASIAFKISKSFSEKFKSQSKKNNSKYISRLVNKINKNTKKHPLLSILIPRLLFLPYIEIAYAAGLVKELKFRYFLFITFILNIIEVLIFIYLGDAVTKKIGKFIIAIFIFILFLLIPRLLKGFYPKLNKYY